MLFRSCVAAPDIEDGCGLLHEILDALGLHEKREGVVLSELLELHRACHIVDDIAAGERWVPPVVVGL